MGKKKRRRGHIGGVPTRTQNKVLATLEFDFVRLASEMNAERVLDKTPIRGQETGTLLSKDLKLSRQGMAQGTFSLPAPAIEISATQAKLRVQNYLEALVDNEGRPHVAELDRTHFEVLIPDLERNQMTYYRFLGRAMEQPPRKLIEELARQADKKWLRGRGGHREEIALTMIALYHSLAWVAPIPTRSGAFDVNKESYLVAVLNGIVEDEEAVELELMGLQTTPMRQLWAYGLAHALAYTDTPIWISIEQDLSELLLMTDLKGIRCGDITLPHPVLMLEVPPGLLTIQDGPDSFDCRLVMAYKMKTPEREYLAVSAMFAYVSSPIPHHVRIGFFYPLEEETELQPIPPDQFTDSQRVFTVASEPVTQVEFYNTILGFVVNATVYMASPRSDVRRHRVRPVSTRSEKEQARAKKSPKPEWEEWVVGSSIKHPAPPRGGDDVPRDSSGHRILKAAFYVKGHWTHQFYGKGRALRKLQWRLPQVRKRHVSDRVVGRTYVEK